LYPEAPRRDRLHRRLAHQSLQARQEMPTMVAQARSMLLPEPVVAEPQEQH
jgi:hypothetical protein